MAHRTCAEEAEAADAERAMVSPLRAFFRKVAFHEGEVEGIDLSARTVTIAHGHSAR